MCGHRNCNGSCNHCNGSLPSGTFMRGPRGLQGAQGVPGADSIVPGPQGIQGIQGIPGTNGATWTSGGGVPVTPGVIVGDHYLNNLNGYVYEWDGLQWNLMAIIIGPQGEQGVQGIQGEPGINGTSPYLSFERLITTEELETFHNSPVELLAAPGANKYYIIHSVIIEVGDGTDYTTSNIRVLVACGDQNYFHDLSIFSEKSVSYSVGNTETFVEGGTKTIGHSFVIDLPLIFTANDAMIGGTRPVVIKVRYEIVDFTAI